EARLLAADAAAAAADLAEAVRLAPDLADAHRLLAAVHFEAGRWDDALAAADRAFALAPDDARVARGRAEVWAARLDPLRAVGDL
ncbi:tetratricopeptide repeat protein, partial [Klebsiella pneumoniae]|nr:tetratricopeptide repeat protein [Klebsiella pneumoniae]